MVKALATLCLVVLLALSASCLPSQLTYTKGTLVVWCAWEWMR